MKITLINLLAFIFNLLGITLGTILIYKALRSDTHTKAMVYLFFGSASVVVATFIAYHI